MVDSREFDSFTGRMWFQVGESPWRDFFLRYKREAPLVEAIIIPTSKY
jgi:hypothetical protein